MISYDYIAGCYLVKKKRIDFGEDIGKIVSTCSGCINALAFDYWRVDWMSDKPQDELNIQENEIKKIQKWTSDNFNSGPINTLATIKKLKSIKIFFSKMTII